MIGRTFAADYRHLIERHPEDKRALITNEGIVTFGLLKEHIERHRNGLLSLGVGPGDRIAVCFPNSEELLYLAFALCELGACIVPIHPTTPPPFLIRLLGFLRTCRLIVPEGSGLTRLSDLPCDVLTADGVRNAASENAPRPPLPGPDSVAVIIPTSGTTGEPKMVPISQSNFAGIIDSTRALIEPMKEVEEGRAYIMVFPLSSSGILPTMAQLALGSTYVLTDDVSPPNFLGLIEKHRLDGLQGPPAYLEALTQFPAFDKFDVSSITRINSGSDFVPNKLLRALKRRFPNLTHVGIGYGLAETSAIVMAWNAHCDTDLDVPTNRFRIINPEENEVLILQGDVPALEGEEGEICIRGLNVISGYLGNQALTEKTFDNEGFLHTGDVGRLRGDGCVELLGRRKFTIKRGGRSIAPQAVSSALEEHPEVGLAAAVGVPHPTFGEMVWAFICPARGVVLTEGNINAYCRENLPPYLRPDSLVFMDALPRTKGVGKIDYSALREIGMARLREMTGDEDG